MSELTDKLAQAGQMHKGTDLGALLQWAVLHIADQDQELAEMRKEMETGQAERVMLANTIQAAQCKLKDIVDDLLYGVPVNIELAKDYAPYKNIMAYHGVKPYAKKSRNQ